MLRQKFFVRKETVMIPAPQPTGVSAYIYSEKPMPPDDELRSR